MLAVSILRKELSSAVRARCCMVVLGLSCSRVCQGAALQIAGLLRLITGVCIEGGLAPGRSDKQSLVAATA